MISRRIVPLLCFAFCVVFSSAAQSPASAVVGYFPQWGVYNDRYLPRDLVRSGAIEVLTQIDYSQAGVANSACTLADPQADVNLTYTAENSVDGKADSAGSPFRGNLHQFALLKARYPRLRLLISIEGKRTNFDEAAKPENRAAFVHSCVARFLQGHLAPGIEAGRLFDGIDLDWEYPDADHAADFLALLAEFRHQMDRERPGLIFSIATGASAKNIAAVDWAAAAKSLDQIGVMAYDFQGPWSHTTGFVAPLQSVNPNDETVATAMADYLSAGAPARKLLMGVPFYAYQWHGVADGGVHGLGQHGDAVHGNLNHATVTSLLGNPGAKVYRDPAGQTPWLYDGDNFLTFDDADSLRQKVRYAREQHLGGFMVWELSGDDRDGALIRAIAMAARSERADPPKSGMSR